MFNFIEAKMLVDKIVLNPKSICQVKSRKNNLDEFEEESFVKSLNEFLEMSFEKYLEKCLVESMESEEMR